MAQLNSTTVNGDLTVSGSLDIDSITADSGTISGGLEVEGALTNAGTAVSLDGHTHSRLTNNYGDGGEVLYVYDSGYYYLRPSNSVSLNGSSGYPWYRTYTNLLNVVQGAAVGGPLDINGITTAHARVQPYASSQVNLGYSDKRWMNIYSNTAVNTGSDLNIKKDLEKIDDRYIEMFDIIQPYSYKFIDGTSGRTHTGFISQYVEQAMGQVGLKDTDLGFFCKDAVYKDIKDEDGNVIGQEPVLDENGNQKYFYSLRYEEYIAIMTEKIKRMEQKHAEEKANFEARLSALENKISYMQ